MCSFEFCSQLWLSYCGFFFVCMIQSVSYMLWMKKVFNGFLIKKLTWTLHVIKAPLVHELYFVHVVEAFKA